MSWKDTVQPIQTPSTDSPKSWRDSVQDAPGQTSDLKDLGIGLGQGATLGFGDEILGAGQAAKDVLTGPSSLSDLAKLYRQHQQDNQKGVEDAQKRSPYLVGGGELIGGLPLAALTGGAGEIAEIPQMMKTGATIGAIAGAGGSKGTIENNPLDIAKDAAFGAGTGTIAGAITPTLNDAASGISSALGDVASSIGKKANVPVDALKKMAQDSTMAKQLIHAFQTSKQNGLSFQGLNNEKNILANLNNTADSLTNQVLQPRNDAGKLYGQILGDASDNGATLANDPDLMSKVDQAKELILGKKTAPQTIGNSQGGVTTSDVFNPLTLGTDQVTTSMPGTTSTIPGKTIPGRGGLSPEMSALLQKFGSTSTDPMTLNKITQSLSPQEAKTLQNALRATAGKSQYQDSNAIGDLVNSLTPAIDQTLPAGQLSQANNMYKSASEVAEPFINKGETNPDMQKKLMSDFKNGNTSDPTIKNYLYNTMSKLNDDSATGGEARDSLSGIMDQISGLNQKTGTQLLDPDQIMNQIQKPAADYGVYKKIYGEKSSGGGFGLDNISQMITGSPYRVADLAGAGVKNTGSAAKAIGNFIGVDKLPELSRNIYNATDDALQGAAQKLQAAGHTDMAQSLSTALQNKNSNSKNAALFTIMQNPQYRKTVFGANDSDQNQ